MTLPVCAWSIMQWGSTALHFAVRWREGDVVQLLLDGGARLNIKDGLGRLAEALLQGFVTVVQASSNLDHATRVLEPDRAEASDYWQSSGGPGAEYRHWILFKVSGCMGRAEGGGRAHHPAGSTWVAGCLAAVLLLYRKLVTQKLKNMRCTCSHSKHEVHLQSL